MRISDWSSDVCSSDLRLPRHEQGRARLLRNRAPRRHAEGHHRPPADARRAVRLPRLPRLRTEARRAVLEGVGGQARPAARKRSEEHTSELQSLMRISYAVFCLKKKNNTTTTY